MALHMRRTLLSLHRATCSTLKPPELLDVFSPAPLLLTVRTKKRYFVPPAVKLKGRDSRRDYKEVDYEAMSRASGKVFRQQFQERPINISCTAEVIDAYIPPEGDARLSTLSKEGIKQRTEMVRQTAASALAIRKIKEHDPTFSTKTFAVKAQEIFIDAHNALTNFNKVVLHSLVTERCYPEMTRGNRFKTIRWKFLESLEPPKVVHSRCSSMGSNDNLYGQVTVRMHSKQTLAIYDRFGRLMLGDEEQPKDVLEYLVIERHLVNPYGSWRLHGKIVPAWAPAKDPIIKTICIPGPKLGPSQEFDPETYEVPKPKAVQWHK